MWDMLMEIEDGIAGKLDGEIIPHFPEHQEFINKIEVQCKTSSG